MKVTHDALFNGIEFLKELQAEWEWKRTCKLERYNRQIRQLDATLTDLENQFQTQLPTLEEVQQVYKDARQNNPQ